ncbi:MAG: nitrogen regulation protein NR(II) [Phycisphaerae bacterium]
MSELTELIGGLAHELRNPLSTLMVNLRLLAEDLRDEHGDADALRRRALLKLEVVRREAERLQGLFDEFLNLTGTCRFHLIRVNVREVVSRLATFIEPMARSRGVVLQVDGPSDALYVSADEDQLSQALLNIALNALEAMPDGGTLRIGVRRDGAGVALTMSDTGAGIAPEDASRIMRPFFSTKARGTGLGLSITRRIVAGHGGSLSFESSPGRGTTFTIRLPGPDASPVSPPADDAAEPPSPT